MGRIAEICALTCEISDAEISLVERALLLWSRGVERTGEARDLMEVARRVFPHFANFRRVAVALEDDLREMQGV